MTIFVSMIIYIAYFVYKRNKWKLSQTVMKYNQIFEAYNNVNNELILLRENTQELERIKQKEAEKYKQMLDSHTKDKATQEIEQKWLNIDEVVLFHEYAKIGKHPSEKEWANVQKKSYEINPNFMQKILSEKNNLSETEIRTVILTRLRFRAIEIATLLCLSKQRISNMRGDINQKLFRQKGTETFDFNVKQL